jgi:hypothetical protein
MLSKAERFERETSITDAKAAKASIAEVRVKTKAIADIRILTRGRSNGSPI